MCRVSVILPVYNGERTIDRCIESVIAQTYSAWELICCDDCSQDGTYVRLLAWQQQDHRIKVLRNEKNSRAAQTRNKCIARARGEYIAFIDDDDYCVPQRLEKQVRFLDQHPEFAFTGSRAYVFNKHGVIRVTACKERPQVRDFLWNSAFLNPSVMLRRHAVEKAGCFRTVKETRRCEDYDLFMRLYAMGCRGYNLQEPLIYYWRGDESFRKCAYEYRIDEMYVRYWNFKALKLLPWYFPYVIKPLFVGLIPISLLDKMKGNTTDA